MTALVANLPIKRTISGEIKFKKMIKQIKLIKVSKSNKLKKAKKILIIELPLNCRM